MKSISRLIFQGKVLRREWQKGIQFFKLWQRWCANFEDVAMKNFDKEFK